MTDDDKKDAPAAKNSHPARAPLILTCLLLLASGCVCAYIWNGYQNMKEEAAAANRQYDALKERESELRSLLALSPCEAAARAAGTSTASKGGKQ